MGDKLGYLKGMWMGYRWEFQKDFLTAHQLVERKLKEC